MPVQGKHRTKFLHLGKHQTLGLTQSNNVATSDFWQQCLLGSFGFIAPVCKHVLKY